MDVLVLIDKLDDLVHNGKRIPLTDDVRVDKEEIYDILDQMRATIPEEIKQARWIVKERQEMLAEAKREAERIVKEARDRQQRLVSQEEITRQAERAAEDIIEDARAREREIRLGAEDYADEILKRSRSTSRSSSPRYSAAASASPVARSPPRSADRPGRSVRHGHAGARAWWNRGVRGYRRAVPAVIEVLDGDITALQVDAIANAANTRLLHGGGVAGAIARAGGPAVQRESDERSPIGLGAVSYTHLTLPTTPYV